MSKFVYVYLFNLIFSLRLIWFKVWSVRHPVDLSVKVWKCLMTHSCPWTPTWHSAPCRASSLNLWQSNASVTKVWLRSTKIDGDSCIKFHEKELGSFFFIQKYFFWSARLKYYFKEYMLSLGCTFNKHLFLTIEIQRWIRHCTCPSESSWSRTTCSVV